MKKYSDNRVRKGNVRNFVLWAYSTPKNPWKTSKVYVLNSNPPRPKISVRLYPVQWPKIQAPNPQYFWSFESTLLCSHIRFKHDWKMCVSHAMWPYFSHYTLNCLLPVYSFYKKIPPCPLREHSYMTSDVFWVFLTYLPTLIRWFTT